jgi:hypothetical protein
VDLTNICNKSFLTSKKVARPWVVGPVGFGAGGTVGTTLHQLVQAFVDVPASLKAFLTTEKGSLENRYIYILDQPGAHVQRLYPQHTVLDK